MKIAVPFAAAAALLLYGCGVRAPLQPPPGESMPMQA